MSLIEKDVVADTEITLTDEERQPCEIWTRVMGYHRPVSSFNRGKKGEFAERRYFREQGGERA
ncbi:anaerobic ribonucleoside-triphosphate reductase [Martelella mangrovi]|uniref:Oxidoreductase n=1 Tax=Martelella mangrovi TaxID=1397477 RepID=A0ABV2I5I4_9HYPH|nr:anaerobic ribonucleoside-triphosphate reductase [uncultured Martelella sp.]